MMKEDIRKIRNNCKYINDKYIYGDGKYYIGNPQSPLTILIFLNEKNIYKFKINLFYFQIEFE